MNGVYQNCVFDTPLYFKQEMFNIYYLKATLPL